jgi:SulP family sulfate permease
VFLLILIVALGPVVAIIPMAALVAVMIIVAVSTFDWHSLRTLATMPKSETLVMASTVAVVVFTHNLAIGVVVGVLVAMVMFARRVAHMVDVASVLDPDGTTKIYSVHGEIFFASSNDLVYQFDYLGDPENIVIDMSESHVWDASSVAALDAIVTKYERRGKTVEITGLNQASTHIHERLGGQLNGSH